MTQDHPLKDSNALGFVFFCSPLSAWRWVERGAAEQPAPGRKLLEGTCGRQRQEFHERRRAVGVNSQTHPDPAVVPGSGSAGLWEPWDTDSWALDAPGMASAGFGGPDKAPSSRWVLLARMAPGDVLAFLTSIHCHGRLKLCPQDKNASAFSLPAPDLSHFLRSQHLPPVGHCWVWEPPVPHPLSPGQEKGAWQGNKNSF